MKILLTGATGYIGKRLLSVLALKGHEVVCCVRDKNRFNPENHGLAKISVIEVDFLDKDSLKKIPFDIDGAYYLMHSMSSSADYSQLEQLSAVNFREIIDQTRCRHVVYLSGIANEQVLSKHLESRKLVEEELSKGRYHLTTLRAGIIIGSGSASFEIIRDLVEKLPVMVAPKWLKTKCQPIGIRDVIGFLEQALFCKAVYDKNFDIGGPDVLTYKEMLHGYAKVRGLKRKIFIVPVMTPGLSSYWLYFITSVSYKLAVALVKSMMIEVVCRKSDINDILRISPAGYEKALQRSLSAIETNEIISSWKDSMVSGRLEQSLSTFINVPEFGCFTDQKIEKIANHDKCIDRIWNIGGEKGWYFANGLWRFRGFVDKVFGGVGLRRGRSNPSKIYVGDSIDFWRVLYVNKTEGRLLLFAEMKLPGEAWLEFKISDGTLFQTATFRPKGLWGRMYWYSLYPFHALIFGGMIKSLASS